MTELTPRAFAKCPQCGWLHLLMTATDIGSLGCGFEQQTYYKRCGNPTCRGSTAAFVAAGVNDTPVLAQLPTIPGCIADHLLQ